VRRIATVLVILKRCYATKAYFTFYVAAGAIDLAITLFANQLFRWLERHLRRGMPQHH
jgi:ABC-type arginine transport system permease subunit